MSCPRCLKTFCKCYQPDYRTLYQQSEERLSESQQREAALREALEKLRIKAQEAVAAWNRQNNDSIYHLMIELEALLNNGD